MIEVPTNHLPKTRICKTHDFGSIKVLEFESYEVARDIALSILNLMQPGHRFLAYAITRVPAKDLDQRIADSKAAGGIATDCLHCGKKMGPVPRLQYDVCNACADLTTPAEG